MYNIYNIYMFLLGTDISTKILPVAHIFSSTVMNYLKMLIGIKSLNKKCPTRLSPPPVKLSSFIGGKFSSKITLESNL